MKKEATKEVTISDFDAFLRWTILGVYFFFLGVYLSSDENITIDNAISSEYRVRETLCGFSFVL